jgi:hypothetical protein
MPVLEDDMLLDEADEDCVDEVSPPVVCPEVSPDETLVPPGPAETWEMTPGV